MGWKQRIKEFDYRSREVLLGGSNQTGGGKATAPLETDQGSAGVFSFLSSTSRMLEQSLGAITVARQNGDVGSVTVTLSAVDGTANNGVDFSFTPQDLTWEAGDTRAKTVFFSILTLTQNKSFSFVLSNPTNFATVDQDLGTIEITLLDKPTGAGGVGFLQKPFFQNESTSITVQVWRTSGKLGAVSIDWGTVDVTAFDGIDYTGASGTLSWNNGEGGAKDITVSLNAVSSDKMFEILLSNPSGGVYLDPDFSIAQVTIVNDTGGAGSLAFELTAVPKVESTTLSLKVKRLGGSSGAASCSHATANITAVAGTNYTSSSGTLNWGAGDAADKTISVTLSTVSGPLQFSSTLSSPTGATLKTDWVISIVTIYDSAGYVPWFITVARLGIDTAMDRACITRSAEFVHQDWVGKEASHVIYAMGIASTVIGFNGGTDSFGHGLELANSDETSGGGISKDKRFRMRKVQIS